MWVQFLGQEDPLEEEMATYSNILTWRSPWTEEPGGLQSRGGHKESDMTERLSVHTGALTYIKIYFLIKAIFCRVNNEQFSDLS